jgi:Mg/Co/Ni transporter MgtE
MVTKNAKKRGAADRLLKALWTYIFFGCILSIIITVLPMFYQQNQVTQALVLPFALVLSFVPDWIGKIMKMVRKN